MSSNNSLMSIRRILLDRVVTTFPHKLATVASKILQEIASLHNKTLSATKFTRDAAERIKCTGSSKSASGSEQAGSG